jgi:hypothetical protein
MLGNILSAELLLNTLLDRFESSAKRVRDVLYTIDYKKVGGPTAQDNFHRVLQDAERARCIKLEKGKFGRITGEFARVRLVDAEKLYKFLSRLPASASVENARQIVEGAVPELLRESFFEMLIKDASSSWTANKSFLGLRPANVETFITVLRLANAIIHLSGRDIDHRTFSRRTVKDSKALERLEGRVVQVLKRWNPSLAGNEPREVLEAYGIVRRAHSLFVKGPISIESAELQLQGTGELFLGLPWTSVQHARLNKPVEYIITIENPTSFWRYCLEVQGCYLALLADGFPARDVLSSMVHFVRVARSTQEVPVFHWGDIDAGGVRIAAHLENAFECPVALHEMNPELATKFGSPLQSRTGLDRLRNRTGSISELAGWLLGPEGMALEQEELDPRAPMF